MANVFLSGEAYARLRAAKRDGESFSDVVIREVKQDIDMNEFLGCCKGINADKLVKELQAERRREG